MTRTRLIIVAVVVLAGIWLINASIFTIDQGERGVVLRNGAVIRTAEPGLGFLLPAFDTVKRISTQNQAALYEDVVTYSKDQQPASITLSVTYHVPAEQVAQLYSEYGTVDAVVLRLLDRKVPRALKEVFGKFNAALAIQDRTRLGLEVQTAVMAEVTSPIVVDGVQIENINFSAAYEKSVEDRMLAEVEVLKVHQNAEREKIQAEIAIIQAKAIAEASLAKAEADAKAIRLRGDAEAAAIKARGDALAANPSLILLTQAEKWDGVLPQTMVPGGTVPFLQVK
jgi:regulator of protease activity HflC (stomatin/prohibitin superfamily)